jgi:hypothetical protein
LTDATKNKTNKTTTTKNNKKGGEGRYLFMAFLPFNHHQSEIIGRLFNFILFFLGVVLTLDGTTSYCTTRPTTVMSSTTSTKQNIKNHPPIDNYAVVNNHHRSAYL